MIWTAEGMSDPKCRELRESKASAWEATFRAGDREMEAVRCEHYRDVRGIVYRKKERKSASIDHRWLAGTRASTNSQERFCEAQ